MSADFKLLSLNVRGLGISKKRRAVFTWCKRKKSDIILFQETHSTRETQDKWKKEWGGQIYFSHGKSNARGVAIFIRKGLDHKIVHSVTDSNGRLIILSIEIQDVLYKIINIYAPNNDGMAVSFFHNLSIIFQNEGVDEEDNIVIGGDFNCPLNPLLDKMGGINIPRTRLIDSIKKLQTNFFLDDIWRIKNPTIKSFTWSQRSPLVFCRLDYWLISHHLQDSVEMVDIQNSIKSDHSAIVLHLQPTVDNLKGPGFWKLNTSLLDDNEYLEQLKEKMSQIRNAYADAMQDKRVLWEWMKYNIRDFTIQYSKAKARERRSVEQNLETKLLDISKRYEENPSNENFRIYEKYKAELEQFYEFKVKGIITRARVRWFEKGEKSTKYFLGLCKRNFSRKTIRKLKINNIIITDPHRILFEQQRFYEHLYKSRNIDLNSEDSNFFFTQGNIPKLSNEQRLSCEGKLSGAECKEIIKTFDDGKTPGNDGLPIEFYKTFWTDIGENLVDCMNHSFEKGEMSPSQRQAIITLIDKKGKDREFLENWRPISLVNVDVKIASKAIAFRIRKHLPDLIHYNQTAYVENRYIGDTIRSLIDIMTYTKEVNIPGLFLFIDFEKAFDSLEWNFMLKSLRTFNFGTDILGWITMFYTNISSCVINNGMASKQFLLSRGVRQGDPLSPYLFILAVELFSIAVRNDNKVQGIQLGNKEVRLAQYADDTTAVLKDVQSAHRIFELLSKFENVSGLKMNNNKTEALWIGSKRNSKETPLNVSWPTTPVRVLGIYLSYDQFLFQKYNFDHIIQSVEKIINIWKQRNLTVYGKVIVAKTFLISKLGFIGRIVVVPSEILIQLERQIANFVWNGPDKIKRRASFNNLKFGGLELTHLPSWIQAQKFSWIKRFLDENVQADWKEYLEWLLKDKGGKLFLYCDFDIKQIRDSFYGEVLGSLMELKKVAGVASGEYILWNNKNIQIDNRSIFYADYYNLDICLVSDLYDKNIDMKKDPNFLKYFGLKAASQKVKNKLLEKKVKLDRKQYFKDCLSITDPKNSYKKELQSLSSKDTYTLLVNQVVVKPTCFNKLKEKFEISEEEIEWSFTSLYELTKETRLRDFQYRCLHLILNTKYVLRKKKILDNDCCSFCKRETETIEHLFFECLFANQFWQEFRKFWMNISKINLSLTFKDIMMGNKNFDLILNYLFVLGKWHIFYSSKQEQRPNFQIFIEICKQKFNIEYEIAEKNQALRYFTKKWHL